MPTYLHFTVVSKAPPTAAFPGRYIVTGYSAQTKTYRTYMEFAKKMAKKDIKALFNENVTVQHHLATDRDTERQHVLLLSSPTEQGLWVKGPGHRTDCQDGKCKGRPRRHRADPTSRAAAEFNNRDTPNFPPGYTYTPSVW